MPSYRGGYTRHVTVTKNGMTDNLPPFADNDSCGIVVYCTFVKNILHNERTLCFPWNSSFNCNGRRL
jgi:hypothetical protein